MLHFQGGDLAVKFCLAEHPVSSCRPRLLLPEVPVLLASHSAYDMSSRAVNHTEST